MVWWFLLWIKAKNWRMSDVEHFCAAIEIEKFVLLRQLADSV